MNYKEKLKGLLYLLKKWFVNLVKKYWSLNLEAKIGILFLIPPIIGVIMFILNLLDVNIGFEDFPESWNCVSYSHTPSLYSQYATGKSIETSYAYAGTPAIPLYLGLMAIAGAYLIKGNLSKKENKIN